VCSGVPAPTLSPQPCLHRPNKVCNNFRHDFIHGSSMVASNASDVFGVARSFKMALGQAQRFSIGLRSETPLGSLPVHWDTVSDIPQKFFGVLSSAPNPEQWSLMTKRNSCETEQFARNLSFSSMTSDVLSPRRRVNRSAHPGRCTGRWSAALLPCWIGHWHAFIHGKWRAVY
jgi:hypothetical protein